MKKKLKTHKATAKRFKVTGTGKVKYNKQGNNHLKANKSRAQKARKKSTSTLSSKKEANKILKLMVK